MGAPRSAGPIRDPNRHNPAMLKTAARILLLRVLPRRLLPIVTIAEAVLLIRSVRNRAKTKVNEPAESRTAPPRTAAASTTRTR
jgi:hypothetical protein